MIKPKREYTEIKLVQKLRELGALKGVSYKFKNDEHTVDSKNFNLSIISNSKWLGVTLNVYCDHDKVLHYFDDTDNYDISSEKHARFRDEIGADILELLEAIAAEKILIGYRRRSPSMIIPFTHKYIRISQGRFMTASKDFKALDNAKKDGVYSRLQLSK